MTPYHPLLRHGAILEHIAENLYSWDDVLADIRDVCNFAKAFRYVNVPANAVLYHTLDDRTSIEEGRQYLTLLLRTLKASPQLATLVKRVNTGLVHVALVMELLQSCTSLHVVHLDFSTRLWNDDPKYLVPIAPWFTLPACVQSLSMYEPTLASGMTTWHEGFIENLLTPSGIRFLKLKTSLTSAKQVLAILAAQLVELSLVPSDNEEAATWLASLGHDPVNSLPRLKSLRLSSFRPKSADDVPLQSVAPNLQTLEIECITTKHMGILFECLANPEWCPGLLGLPVLDDVRVGMEIDGFSDTTSLEAKCAQAKVACLGRSAWQNPVDQFDNLLRRVRELERAYNDKIVEMNRIIMRQNARPDDASLPPPPALMRQDAPPPPPALLQAVNSRPTRR